MVNKSFAENIKAGMLVLDAGAGDQPYRRLFDHATYESADFLEVDKRYVQPTYVCDLSSIPVEHNRYDGVIFNQVLEHLSDPLEVLKELQRVLKPTGKIICTCPLFYEEHDTPYDFYRYTQFAHRDLFARAGFEITELKWLEGWFCTVDYMLETMARYLPIRPHLGNGGLVVLLLWPFVILTKFVAIFFAGIFYRLDLRIKLVGRGFPKNYVVIAQKNDRGTI